MLHKRIATQFEIDINLIDTESCIKTLTQHLSDSKSPRNALEDLFSFAIITLKTHPNNKTVKTFIDTALTAAIKRINACKDKDLILQIYHALGQLNLGENTTDEDDSNIKYIAAWHTKLHCTTMAIAAPLYVPPLSPLSPYFRNRLKGN